MRNIWKQREKLKIRRTSAYVKDTDGEMAFDNNSKSRA